MKIRLIKDDLGNFDIHIKRTRYDEGRDIFVEGVEAGSVGEVVGEGVRKIRQYARDGLREDVPQGA